LKKPF